MTIIGIEFAGSQMNYVVVRYEDGGELKVLFANRLSLRDTRSPDSLRAFQQAVQTLQQETSPTVIAIKDKPESGAMQAGAAALKMEGIVLANAPCQTRFISGARINKCEIVPTASLKAYHHLAFRVAACAALDR